MTRLWWVSSATKMSQHTDWRCSHLWTDAEQGICLWTWTKQKRCFFFGFRKERGAITLCCTSLIPLRRSSRGLTCVQLENLNHPMTPILHLRKPRSLYIFRKGWKKYLTILLRNHQEHPEQLHHWLAWKWHQIVRTADKIPGVTVLSSTVICITSWKVAGIANDSPFINNLQHFTITLLHVVA